MSFFTLLLVFSLLTIASAYDLKYYRIPNNITYPAILIGLAYNTFTSGFEGIPIQFDWGIGRYRIFYFTVSFRENGCW